VDQLEQSRLASLRSLNLLDTPADGAPAGAILTFRDIGDGA
jgi:hypothetical protein